MEVAEGWNRLQVDAGKLKTGGNLQSEVKVRLWISMSVPVAGRSCLSSAFDSVDFPLLLFLVSIFRVHILGTHSWANFLPLHFWAPILEFVERGLPLHVPCKLGAAFF